jgi:hypothetical protein
MASKQRVLFLLSCLAIIINCVHCRVLSSAAGEGRLLARLLVCTTTAVSDQDILGAINLSAARLAFTRRRFAWFSLNEAVSL